MDLTRSEIQQFINSNLNADISELILKYADVDGIPIREIADQISSKNKAKTKVPTWFKVDGLIYPPPISMEQCSSDETGSFKSKLFSGRKALDLTGGAGIDSYFLSHSFQQVDYVEIDSKLVKVCKYNFTLLNVHNVHFHCFSAEDFLNDTKDTYDLIYVDPSRRIDKKKVFKLSDSSPDIIGMQEDLIERGQDILIKTSPFLDIHKTLFDLQRVMEVYIIGIRNEVKEVLYHLSGKINSRLEPLLISVNITTSGHYQSFKHLPSEESICEVVFKEPTVGEYIYEPNSSLLKSGAFKLSANRWGLAKFHSNTHLNISNEIHEDYPGRIFRIKEIYQSIKKGMNSLKGRQLNIIARNSRLKPEELKKKLKTLDGGEEYLIAARTISEGTKLFYCDRIT